LVVYARRIAAVVVRLLAGASLLAGFVSSAACASPLDQPVGLSLPTAAPFVLQADEQSRARATRCLTEAVYYEAAREPRAGQEAVAQVVLNRLMRAGFPKSVCGVVYEGAERTTGCQFTFTCDGSLARRPVPSLWDAAQDVATAALNGYVAPVVGDAINYHAAWMTPYWSKSLVSVGRIGGHIFYRAPAHQDSSTASGVGYAGAEPVVTADANIADPARAAGARPEAAARAPAGTADFSVWGLKIATLTKVHGRVVAQAAPE
jgi:hypothetical protein